MNLPQATQRIEEIMAEHGSADPFPVFEQKAPPASVGEAIAAAEEEVPEGETPPEEGAVEEPAGEEGKPEEEDAAADSQETEAPPSEEEAAAELAERERVEAEDIAWVKEHKGFDITDPVVAKTLRHQDEMIARQGTEVGEARKAIEQERLEREAFQAQIEQRMEQQFEPDEEWEEWADEGVRVDPLQTIILAGEQGGPGAARFALSRWHAADPAAATAFQIEAGQVAAAEQQPFVQVDAEGSWGRVAERHSDLLDYKESMTALLDDPETLDRMNRLASVDPDAALENLYLQARIGQTDKQRSDALAKANAARKAAADQSAADATVASATASPGHGESAPLSAAEQVRANVRAELGLVVED